MKNIVKDLSGCINNLECVRRLFPLALLYQFVEFAENYRLQPQNETQSQYYNSIQIFIFVHITYRHAPDSAKDNQKIIREYHFYMSDDRSHSHEFVSF